MTAFRKVRAAKSLLFSAPVNGVAESFNSSNSGSRGSLSVNSASDEARAMVQSNVPPAIAATLEAMGVQTAGKLIGLLKHLESKNPKSLAAFGLVTTVGQLRETTWAVQHAIRDLEQQVG